MEKMRSRIIMMILIRIIIYIAFVLWQYCYKFLRYTNNTTIYEIGNVIILIESEIRK